MICDNSNKSIIGITGPIGAGKSVISRILRCKGYKVFDTDYEAKKLMNTDQCLIDEIKTIAGNKAFDINGALDKNYMSKVIFSDIKKRELINTLVHKRVRDSIEKFIFENQSPVFIESALLKTGKIEGFCNTIWIVTSPLEKRIERIKLRNNKNEAEIKKINETQLQEYSDLSSKNINFINNDGEISLLLFVFNYLKNL